MSLLGSDDAHHGGGEYVTPPRSFVDDEGRTIEFEKGSAADVDGLVEMYLDLRTEDRSQGIPPRSEADVREWLEYVFPEDSQHLVARHEDRPVGHAFLIPAGDGRHELAIFVHPSYQAAHVGTELMYTLLGYGQQEGVNQVWLSVESWNDHAITLYQNVGFEKHRVARTEIEMTIKLQWDKRGHPL